jgi:hypothetical protein
MCQALDINIHCSGCGEKPADLAKKSHKKADKRIYPSRRWRVNDIGAPISPTISTGPDGKHQQFCLFATFRVDQLLLPNYLPGRCGWLGSSNRGFNRQLLSNEQRPNASHEGVINIHDAPLRSS